MSSAGRRGGKDMATPASPEITRANVRRVAPREPLAVKVGATLALASALGASWPFGDCSQLNGIDLVSKPFCGQC